MPTARIVLTVIIATMLLTPLSTGASPPPGSVLDQLVPNSAVTLEKLNDGSVRITDNGGVARAATKAEFKTPLVITAQAKTDSTNIRL
jgi:hypothetical protein